MHSIFNKNNGYWPFGSPGACPLFIEITMIPLAISVPTAWVERHAGQVIPRL